MAARKKRRRIGGPVARRWFAVGALVLVGLLYYRPLHDYVDARSQRAVRVAAVRKLQRQQAGLEQRLKHASSLTRARGRGADARLHPAGRAPLHRQGHPAVAAQAACRKSCCRRVVTDAGSSRRSAAARPRAADASPRCGAVPVRRSGRHRAEPVRSGRRAVPDHVLPDVPASGRRRVAPRSRRRRRALERGDARATPRSPRALPPATSEQRRLRRELAGETTRHATAAPRSTTASAARDGAGSLKCLHAHVAFALARPGYELGERILAEVEPRWPERCCSR